MPRHKTIRAISSSEFRLQCGCSSVSVIKLNLSSEEAILYGQFIIIQDYQETAVSWKSTILFIPPEFCASPKITVSLSSLRIYWLHHRTSEKTSSAKFLIICYQIKNQHSQMPEGDNNSTSSDPPRSPRQPQQAIAEGLRSTKPTKHHTIGWEQFIVWKFQVETTIQGYGLEELINGTAPIPARFTESQHFD